MRAVLIAAALALGACDVQVDLPPPTRVAATPPRDLPAFFDCLREHRATIVSVHRGGPAPGFAENAIPTFQRTVNEGLDPVFLEVDVSRAADGVLVLMHDDDVARTTTGSGAVDEFDAATLQALRLRDEDGQILDARVPTLREALDWANGNAILELDVKRGVSYEDVAREVEAAGAMDRVIFITYSVDGASRLARVAPDAMIYTTITNARDLDTLARRGVDLPHVVAWLGDEELDADLLSALNERGVEGRWGLFGGDPDFAAAVEAGVEGVSVNDAEAAYRAIDNADGPDGYAAAQCAR